MGFFNGVFQHTSKPPQARVAQCGACKLYQTCQSPKMSVKGKGRRKLLLIGEFPSKQEDQQNGSFLGEAGSILLKTVAAIDPDFDLELDLWRTNALICRPPKSRKPKDKEIAYCRPNVLVAIRKLNPIGIILLGQAAVRSVIGHLWREAPGSITRWAGWQIPHRRWDCWILPTFHPVYVARDHKNVGLRLWFESHIAQALSIHARPSETNPRDADLKVEKLYDRDDIERAVEQFIRQGQMVAFDYETNMLKPDSINSEIVSCSITDGNRLVAFPWIRGIQDVMSSFVQSSLPKVGANIKFEDRWTRAILKVPVCNWVWDMMQAAHVLDNRKEISSVKFQAFVQLGVDPYDHHISPLLEASAPNEVNRIREIPIVDLLEYNGLDSLYEYQLALLQRRRFA